VLGLKQVTRAVSGTIALYGLFALATVGTIRSYCVRIMVTEDSL